MKKIIIIALILLAVWYLFFRKPAAAPLTRLEQVAANNSGSGPTPTPIQETTHNTTNWTPSPRVITI